MRPAAHEVGNQVYTDGGGDYAVAFSTAAQVRIHTAEKSMPRHVEVISNDAMSPLFLAIANQSRSQNDGGSKPSARR